ncbi:transposase [Nonomuraea sp. NPDC046802]|uniref:transposase n=1 Tax=Nonomuraea sp. NPDC046802 TaxID=3154919 RepID=UPI0033D64F56
MSSPPGVLSRFREDVYACMRRGHGALYGGRDHGRIDVEQLPDVLAGLPLPRRPDGRIVLAVDVSPRLRSDAPCSTERLFCHAYGRAKSASQFIPGWPYSFVAALEMGRTSWTAPLDVVRLGPTDDATAVIVDQLRGVIERLIAAGQRHSGDPDILIVTDAGYHTRPPGIRPARPARRVAGPLAIRPGAAPALPITTLRPQGRLATQIRAASSPLLTPPPGPSPR